jgi:lactobin A/cerein 7B family class IIb bacteriocin
LEAKYTRKLDMKEIKSTDLNSVNGGLAPLAVWAVKVAVSGAIVVAKSAHTSYQARKSCTNGVKKANVLSYECK